MTTSMLQNAPSTMNKAKAKIGDEKYDQREGKVLLSGTHALARLPLQQRWRDQEAGLNTGAFISGYRGSPLGGYDQELWRIQKRLDEQNIRFQPGVNEDLAATAVWGSQFVNLYPGAKVDGVFGIWYGKTPGVDRSGDALQHANTAGTAPNGGVVALCGDDHACKSSSRAGQSDFQLKAFGMPILYPSNVQEILDYGQHAIAMSRYSGCWVAMKLVTDVIESTEQVEVGLARVTVQTPEFPVEPQGGMHIRAHEPALDMEARLYDFKIPAAVLYARANALNQITLRSDHAKIGIISAGKSWGDFQGALNLLDIDAAKGQRLGLTYLKLGMTWPLDPMILQQFVQGLDVVLVIEEKRPFVEEQVRSLLQDNPSLAAIRVVGKKQPAIFGCNESRRGELPLAGELSPIIIARSLCQLLAMPEPAALAITAVTAGPIRLPNFCSGCPHSTSTNLPEGSRAMAGIGCHSMAVWLRPENTGTYSHMGAEGMFWVGQAPFTEEKHVFVNEGDGTFHHSGSLALRQAVAANARVTYKILYNGYVSMTGGQPHDGEMSVKKIVEIARAEGVERIVVVADDPSRHERSTFPSNVDFYHRSLLDSVQRDLREYDGVSVLVFDQACATERRRQRKKDPSLDIAKRTFINAEVCEGCGDCGVKSNCMSVEPLETELGRKRRINQSSCNKDFSCVEGFCPSFVTVHGGTLKRPSKGIDDAQWKAIPLPALPPLSKGYSLLLAGIGGTGIVTVGTILGQAAKLDGIDGTVLDVTGLAQKYGAVMSHVRFFHAGNDSISPRIGQGEADAVIGCDLIVTSGQEALSKCSPGKTLIVVNTATSPTSDFPRMPDWSQNSEQLLHRIGQRIDAKPDAFDATALATALMGDAIAVNMFLLGYAWQKGRVPLNLSAIEKSIAKNGVEVDFNQKSFEWGRRAAVDLDAVQHAASKQGNNQVIQFVPRQLTRLEDIIADRVKRLVEYQDQALADRYSRLLDSVREKDRALGAEGKIAGPVARYYFKLLANKDEYEVARLYSSPAFRKQIEDQFEGDYKLHFHLGAWPFSQRDAQGTLRKREIGPWMLKAMGVLKKFKFVRNTWADPFRTMPERIFARELLNQYESDVAKVIAHATRDSLTEAAELLGLPEKIRGYGHVREQHWQRIKATRESLLSRIAPGTSHKLAA